MARFRALIALLLASVFCAPALAQSLQRLTVLQLTLAASTASPKVEVPFDLIITARVRERVTDLRNLDLPTLAEEVELLGDEHSVVSDASGTTYTERLRVVAHRSGVITIPPVTLDAIDARDGKPKRYSSNSLSLNVGGGVLSVTRTYDVTGIVFTISRWLAILVVAAIIVRLMVRRRRRPAMVPAPQPDPAPVAPPLVTGEQRLRDARTVLEAERTRPTVMRIRSMVREMVGANDAETLADVLRRIEPEERHMRALLFALERAAFTHDGDLNRSIDHVIDRLNEMVA